MVGLGIATLMLVLLVVFMLRLPGINGLWKSFRRSFLKKKEAAIERFLWLNALIGIAVYLLLSAIRAMGG